MALSLGAKHPLVRLYSRIEFNFGKRSDYSFCVTRAMKDDLRERTGKKYEIEKIKIIDHQSLDFFNIL